MPTRDAILDQCARYPALRPQDLLKFLHQSTFGPGHLVADDVEAWTFSWQNMPRPPIPVA